MRKDLFERLVAFRTACVSLNDSENLRDDGLRLVGDLKAAGEMEALFGISCDTKMDIEIRVEAGKAGTRLLAGSIDSAPASFDLRSLLHVAQDTGLCWKGSLPGQARAHAGLAAAACCMARKDIRILVDELLLPQVPAEVREAALSGIGRLLLERRTKVIGVKAVSLPELEAELPIRMLSEHYADPDYRNIFRLAAECGFSDEWIELIGMGEAYKEDTDPRWLACIARGEIGLADLMDFRIGDVPEISEERMEFPNRVRVYAGLCAVRDADMSGQPNFMAALDHEEEWSMGTMADYLTDAAAVPPEVAKAAIVKLDQMMEEARLRLRADKKMPDSAAKETGPGKKLIR